MAKKKLDLSSMYPDAQDRHKIDTRQAQDKSSKYAVYRQEEQNIETIKRINMAFNDDVYAHIQSNSEKLNITVSSYINAIIKQSDPEKIKEYYTQQEIKISKYYVPRRKGKKSQRITVKFDPEIYRMVLLGAEQYNQTLTQYVNLVFQAMQ